MNNSSEAPRSVDVEKLLRGLNDAEIERLIPTVAFLSIIAAVGIIGNGMVIHVYRTRYKISNSKLFIISVGAIDLLSCCVAIPLEIPLLLEQYTFENVWLCKVSRLFNTLGTCSSSFILLFIAIDRYRKVCKPLARQITPKSARYLCLLSVGLGLLVAWPALFVYGKKTVEIEVDNTLISGSECSTSDKMADSKIPFYYTALFSVMFLAGITSMSILYCFIGCKIRRQTRKMSTFTIRSMSVPMTSSIIGDGDSRKSGEIIPGAFEKYEIARKKNEKLEKKKGVSKRKQKRCNSYNDDSWTDKKEFELSYECDDKVKSLDRKSVMNNAQGKPVGNGNTWTIPEDGCIDDKSQSYVNSAAELSESSDRQNLSEELEKCDHKMNGSLSGSDTAKPANCDQNVSSNSLTSSGEIIPGAERTFRQRVSSIGSRISHVLQRMTSITSATTDTGTIGTLRKTQYLKQARARKTAFVMFVISLAYIISYLPHLILMVMRQINGNFVDDLSDQGRAAYKFFLRSYFLNCAINPLIYGVCDSRFRAACAELFGGCRRKGDNEDS